MCMLYVSLLPASAATLQYFGYEFADRVGSNAIIRKTSVHSPDSPPLVAATKSTPASAENGAHDGSVQQEYEVLQILPFNSDRKRMSLICACPDGQIR